MEHTERDFIHRFIVIPFYREILFIRAFLHSRIQYLKLKKKQTKKKQHNFFFCVPKEGKFGDR